MTTHNLARTIIDLDAATFQELGDRLLPHVSDEFMALEPYGRKLIARKTRRGKPDSFVPCADGRFIAIEYTTDQSTPDDKVLADLLDLSDPAKCEIAPHIRKVVIGVAAQLKPATHAAIRAQCSKQGWECDVFTLHRLVDECEKHMEAVADLLGIASPAPPAIGPDLIVDMEWIESSGYGEAKRAAGYALRWSAEDKVQSRLLQGYEVAYHAGRDGTRHRVRAGDVILLLKQGERLTPTEHDVLDCFRQAEVRVNGMLQFGSLLSCFEQKGIRPTQVGIDAVDSLAAKGYLRTERGRAFLTDVGAVFLYGKG